MFRSLLAKRKQFVPDNPLFFYETGKASGVLRKTRYMFTLTRFSELYYNTVLLRSTSANFICCCCCCCFFFLYKSQNFVKVLSV